MKLEDLMTKEISLNQLLDLCQSNPLHLLIGYLVVSTLFGWHVVRKGNRQQERTSWDREDHMFSLMAVLTSSIWVPFYLIAHITERSKILTRSLGLNPKEKEK